MESFEAPLELAKEMLGELAFPPLPTLIGEPGAQVFDTLFDQLGNVSALEEHSQRLGP